MKTSPILMIVPMTLLLLGLATHVGRAQQAVGFAFTYQGILEVSGAAADGDYDLQFRLYDASTNGNQIGSQIDLSGQSITRGLVNAILDFGDVFDGNARWLEISVQEAGGATWQTLSPRQEIHPAPHAMNAQRLEGLSANDLLAQGVPNPLQLSGSNAATIAGTTTSSTAGHAGVVGTAGGLSANSSAAGVLGRGPALGSNGVGVLGISASGKGVHGQAFEVSGTNYGVYGETGSPDGYAGYFLGGKNYFEGNVGIGTDDPRFPLTLRAADGLGDVGITQNNLGGEYTMEFVTRDEFGGFRTRMMLRGNAGDAIEFFKGNAGQEELTMIIDSQGSVGIGTATPANMLDVAGTTRTNILQIDGGSDLSEGFGLTDEADPGMVVVIDDSQPGMLRRSTAAYDHRVAGIVSGAGGIRPGMVMGQEGSIADGDHPVALSGRVYCWVDADVEAIEPGDLLTTSDRPGHAMKATNRDLASGAILGKAMTALKAGQGLVLVLVSLQ